MTIRERIVDATLRLIEERGITHVTMVAVAEAAGVARATLYNHYRDVDAILNDAAQAHSAEVIAGLREALSVVEDPRDRLEQVVRFVVAMAAHGAAPTSGEAFAPKWNQGLQGFDAELDEQLGHILSDGVHAVQFRDDLDADLAIGLVRHCLAGAMESVAADPQRSAAIARQATSFLSTALAAEPPPGR